MTDLSKEELLQRIQQLEKENEQLKAVALQSLHTLRYNQSCSHSLQQSNSVNEEPLSLEEFKRYGRQMIVPKFGSLNAQKKLRSSKILVVGAGGLGSPALQYLCAAGIGEIGIIDDDTVDVSNLHRQIIHKSNLVGILKCESAKQSMKDLNPFVKVETYPERLTVFNAFEIIDKYDLVLDCTDHPAVRYLINDVCVLLGKTIVSGSGLRAEGQLTILNYDQVGPCYRCFYPQAPEPSSITSCSDGGVIGPAIGLVGVAMAMETIKLLTGTYTRENFTPFLASYSAYPLQQMKTFKMRPKQSSCKVCGDRPEITKEMVENGSIDYVSFCGHIDEKNPPLQKKYRITVQEYSSLLNSQSREHTLIDVRPKEQFEITNLPGSINLDWPLVFSKCDNDKIDLLLPQDITKADQLYVICRFGNDSQLATAKLIEAGYLNAKDIIGGLNKWSEDIDAAFPKY